MSTYNEIALVQAAETVQRIAQDVVATSTAFARRVAELEADLARERTDESNMEIKYEDAKRRAEAAEADAAAVRLASDIFQKNSEEACGVYDVLYTAGLIRPGKPGPSLAKYTAELIGRVKELEEQLNTRYWERIKADNNLLQRRVKDLSEENKGLLAWKSLFDAAPPEAHREMAERMQEADKIKPFVEVWKKRVAELRSLLYEYLNLPASTWCTFDEERRAIDWKVRAVMKCPTCGGAGRVDSGGQNPDGSWIVLECPTCHGKK